MNSTKYFVILTIVLVLGVFAYQGMAAEETSVSYSELLKQAAERISSNRIGKPILPEEFWGFEPFVEEFKRKDVVPFFIDVIQNGPDWQDEYKGEQQLLPHTARWYAVLCLAYSRDQQAYSILIDLLKKGISPLDMDSLKKEILQERIHRANTSRGMMGEQLFVSDDPNSVTAIAEAVRQDIEEKYDIRQFAAAGLGILRDSRAINDLILALEDSNPTVCQYSMFALAELNDMRAIQPILSMADKRQINGCALKRCMEKMTKYKLKGEHNLKTLLKSKSKNEIEPEDLTVTYHEFPELGILPAGCEKYHDIWNYWYKKGNSFYKRKFDERYAAFTDTKHTQPDNNGAMSVQKREIAELGVSVLPLIVQKVKQGQTDLIPLVAELTDNKVSPDAKAEDVANWWQENKETWTIFDYQAPN